MDRFDAFETYASHAVLGKAFGRLNEDELAFARKFLDNNRELDKGKFELAVNRLFIDRSKPKHFKEILELLSCANSALP